MAPRIARGSVVFLGLAPVQGHEQGGQRPCVVVSDSSIAGNQRFPMVAVVPLTRTAGKGILYPRVPQGAGGLRVDSYALTDQVRSVDKRRITRVFGVLGANEMRAIGLGLLAFLGLLGPSGEEDVSS